MTRTTHHRKAKAVHYRKKLGICPTPHKIAYPGQEPAENAMRRTWRTPSIGPRPIRAYPCECKHWHLTHLTVEDHLALTAKATA